MPPLPGRKPIERLYINGISQSRTQAQAAAGLEAPFAAHDGTGGLAFAPSGVPTNHTEAGAADWGHRLGPLARAMACALTAQKAAVMAAMEAALADAVVDRLLGESVYQYRPRLGPLGCRRSRRSTTPPATADGVTSQVPAPWSAIA